MSDHKAPLRLYRQNPSSVDARLEEFQTLLPTLEAWAQQLHLLKVNRIHPYGWVLLDLSSLDVLGRTCRRA